MPPKAVTTIPVPSRSDKSALTYSGKSGEMGRDSGCEMGYLGAAAVAGLGKEEALHNRAAGREGSAGPDFWVWRAT